MKEQAAQTKKVYKGPDKYYESVKRFHRTLKTANDCNNCSDLKTAFCSKT